MKNTLFISPPSHLRVWLLCQDASPLHTEAKKDKAHRQFIIRFIDFSPFWGLVGMSATILCPESFFLRS